MDSPVAESADAVRLCGRTARGSDRVQTPVASDLPPGPAGRLTELADTLERFTTEHAVSTHFVDDPERIAFENVQVFTPTGLL